MATSGTTAPMLKKPTRRGKVPCGVCQGAIVDGKDEALLCEGSCCLWYHRGCASVPPNLYRALSNSDEPFFCLSCTNVKLKEEIKLLKNELSSMVEVRDKFSALVTEVSELRQTLHSLKLKEANQPSSKPLSNTRRTRTYAAAARPIFNALPMPVSTMSGAAPVKEARQGQKIGDTRGNTRTKVKVDGARKIWGTLPTCTTRAVTAAISKLVDETLKLATYQA